MVLRVCSIVWSRFSRWWELTYTGRWTTRSTVPGVRSTESEGSLSLEFKMVTGRMGSPVSMAKINAPFLKGITRPSRVLVPSAKKRTEAFLVRVVFAASMERTDFS